MAQRVKFVGVSLDPETRRADDKLVRYLQTKTHLTLQSDSVEYGAAVRQLADWPRGAQPYVARVTPYVYIAAEMLGANLKVLGTYRSAATGGGTTYHSYFVVKRSDISASAPGLDDLLRYVRNLPDPAHFVYHDKFSTSSYFLPALLFHKEKIFATTDVDAGFTRILSTKLTKLGASSSDLVEAVAAGQADFAAVWDGTKNKYKDTERGKEIHFIELPTVIPNDLLVCAAWLDKTSQDAIIAAIKEMKDTTNHIDIGDFQWWERIEDVPEAKDALDYLRRQAAEHPAPVTVNVEAVGNAQMLPEYLEAARQAVRLSGTELVLMDSADYKHLDITWKLELIHDGAVVLTTCIEEPGRCVAPQRVPISFTDPPDLTKRIGVLIHSRMHRIRYVWPYQETSPIIIRNVDFSIPKGDSLQVRKITWLDPERNYFREGDPFDARVEATDFFKFQLEDAHFPKTQSGELDFDPMSNVAYRVILVRPSQERPMFFVLTVAFVALLALAAVGLVFDVRRKPIVSPQLEFPTEELFLHAYQTRVETYHEPWANREVHDASVLWCDRGFVEEFVNELKVRGQLVDWTTVKRQSASFLATLPLMKGVLGAKWEREVIQELLVDPAKVGDSERLNKLMSILVKYDGLALFVGQALELDCLNDVVYRLFKPFDGATGLNNKDAILSWENPMLVRFVSKHLREVLTDGEKRLCLFRQTWNVEENEDRYLLTRRGELPVDLQIGSAGQPLHAWTLEFSFSRDRLRVPDLARGSVDAWILGRISERSTSGSVDLRLRFRTMAVLRA